MVNKTRQKKMQSSTTGKQNNPLFPDLKYRPSGRGFKVTEV
jgi:hypothetical protein